MRKISRGIGTIATLKKPLFKQDNRISSIPIYPIYLHELTVIDYISMDVIGGE